jgi:hypothetical protein
MSKADRDVQHCRLSMSKRFCNSKVAPVALVGWLLVGCGGAPVSPTGDGAVPGADGGTVADMTSASPPNGDDGTPTRQACVSKYGTGLTAAHGRLDGYLVSIVAPTNESKCNADNSHVHLQVLMNNAIYDVAVDTGSSGDDIYYLAKDMAPPGGAWAEGWHTSDALNYSSLGLKSTDFTDASPTDAPGIVEMQLATTNHISVFGTGYNTNGMHLIHYESGKDGALVLEPQAATSHVLFFRFAGDNF